MPRSLASLLTSALLAGALGCGAVAPDDLSDAVGGSAASAGAPLPLAALGIPPPSPALRRLAGSRDPVIHIDDPADPRLYEVWVSLSGARAFLLAADARAEHDPRRLDREETGPPPGCPAAVCGHGSLPVGAPAEAALLLAIADLHWQGPGVNRGMVRTAAEDDLTQDTVGSTRQIIRFDAGATRCAAQQKLFSAAGGGAREPADPVVAAHQKAVGIDPERLPVAGTAAGGGQLLLRQRRAEPGEGSGYVLELHVAFDHAGAREAEVVDAVVVCRSPQPIDPARLPGHAHRLARDPSGHWAAVAFPR